jgi:hypothetical protein
MHLNRGKRNEGKKLFIPLEWSVVESARKLSITGTSQYSEILILFVPAVQKNKRPIL